MSANACNVDPAPMAGAGAMLNPWCRHHPRQHRAVLVLWKPLGGLFLSLSHKVISKISNSHEIHHFQFREFHTCIRTFSTQ